MIPTMLLISHAEILCLSNLVIMGARDFLLKNAVSILLLHGDEALLYACNAVATFSKTYRNMPWMAWSINGAFLCTPAIPFLYILNTSATLKEQNFLILRKFFR